MRTWALIVAGVALATSMVAQRFGTEDRETIRHTLDFGTQPGTHRLEVDNVNGFIHIVGYNGRNIELTAYKTTRGRSAADIQDAKNEVVLDIGDKSNLVRIYVDGPFRGRDGSRRSRTRYNYEVQYDFDLRVPPETGLFLKTVNDGDIRVERTTGDFEIDNINGGIEMVEVAGSGRAYALNKNVKVTFDRNPKGDAYFGSLNGDVDVYFRPDLSADLRFKTFNGEVYTDFEVGQLPPAPITTIRQDGKQVYKRDRWFGVRVAKGGPEFKFDGFNGDIRVHKR